MKRAIEDLMYQVLIDLIFRFLTEVSEWAATIPW